MNYLLLSHGKRKKKILNGRFCVFGLSLLLALLYVPLTGMTRMMNLLFVDESRQEDSQQEIMLVAATTTMTTTTTTDHDDHSSKRTTMRIPSTWVNETETEETETSSSPTNVLLPDSIIVVSTNTPLHNNRSSIQTPTTRYEGLDSTMTNQSNPSVVAPELAIQQQQGHEQEQITTNISTMHEIMEGTNNNISSSTGHHDGKETIQQSQQQQPDDPSNFDPKTMHETLLDYYNDVPLSSDSNTSYLWDNPQSRLPEWMKRYLRWHADKKAKLANETTAKQSEEPIKFIVLQCLVSDDRCGGLSDRLKPLPLIVRYAYYTKRVVLIHWSRPGRLEEFLLPPKGGMDWTVPEWMVPVIEDRRSGILSLGVIALRKKLQSDVFLIRSRIQDFHGGMHHYDDQLVQGEANFISIFHDFWKVVFTPSPPVRALIESEMERLGLVPSEYVGAHLRALYAIKERDQGVTRNWARNAINCASEIRPRKKVFFASDSDSATDFAREYAMERHATVITRTPNPNPPLHMDMAKDWHNRSISDFYDTFVDVYIMGHSDCMTYNNGGYGLLGLFIGRNSSCGIRQDALSNPRIRNPCIWVDDPQNGTRTTKMHERSNPLLSHATIYEEPIVVTNSTKQR